MSTPHIEAKNEEIAKTVIMPGDPLRAKYVAENYLTDVICFNKVRNNLGFTGIYKGQRISVMSSGMGCPSIGLYSFELYKYYNVQNIIRIGTAGALKEDINLKDIVLAQGACTDSNYINNFSLPGTYAPIASYSLLSTAVNEAKNLRVNFEVGNVLSSDIFYAADNDLYKQWQKMGILAIEMESSALYANAALLKKQALCILAITNYIFKEGGLTFDEKEKGLNNMIILALNTALNC